jgi:hypothetical protein
VWQGERERDGNPNPNPKSDSKPPSEVPRSPPSALAVLPSYTRNLKDGDMSFKRAQEIAHRYDNCALQTGCFEIFVRCYSCLFLQQVVHVVGCLFLHGFELAVE